MLLSFGMQNSFLISAKVLVLLMISLEAAFMLIYGKRQIEAFEMWCYRMMPKISWVDKVTIEQSSEKL